MPILPITIRNKQAVYTGSIPYVCSNSDYTVVFTFDAEWETHLQKTVRFCAGGTYVDQEITGNTCPVPVLEEGFLLQVGVYAGNLQTTTAAMIRMCGSIRSIGGEPAQSAPAAGSGLAAIQAALAAKVDAYQGTARAGARLVVGDNGYVTTEFPIVNVTGTGETVSVEPIAGTELSVVSHIAQAAWNNGDRLYLRQTNGGSVIDVAGIVRTAMGGSWTANGLTCTVNDDDTLTVTGTMETESSWAYALNCECGSYIRLLPPGTYTVPTSAATIFYAAYKPITDSVESLGNKSGTFTVDEPFYIRQIQIIYSQGQAVDETIPLTLMAGDTVPDTGFAYTAKEYEALFTAITTAGTYNWQTGELRDADGNLVQTLTPAGPFEAMEGVNTFFTGAGESDVTYTVVDDGSAGELVGGETAAEKARDDLMQSISVEYGRTLNTGYQLVRIPRTTNNGRTVRPAVRLTSADGTLEGAKCSALTYARREKTAFTLNAGLFDVTTLLPLGQTIIDGVSVVNEKHPQGANGETISDTECYPLCIDGDGMLSAPYPNDADTADMIADGVVQACTGWVTMVDEYEIAADEIASEIVHTGKYIQNIIGQFDNGDYCVLSTSQAGYENNPAPRDEGLTKTEAAQLLVDRGVRFAYALDGGGSAETVLGERQINPIYEGTAGRSIPAVIVFETI